MKEIIEIFRMEELSVDVRIRTMRKLGEALDYQYAANWTGEVIDELEKILITQ